tara:strand:- start:2150 stop:2353 length:204 start_codon:yes stop_codon:yes gene_type:complete
MPFTKKSNNKVGGSRPNKKVGGTRKRKLNAFMAAKEKARKADKDSFTYKGQTYNRKMTETGMAVYCR